MMISFDTLILVLVILLVHWFADFVLQTEEESKHKSTSKKRLIEHTFTYANIWFTVSLCLMAFYGLPMRFMWFAPITFVFHTATDYITSRITKWFWQRHKYMLFFRTIGFDQWLHYLQLFATFYFLTK